MGNLSDNSGASFLEDVIRNRRTNLNVYPDQSIDAEVIRSLCESIHWAPNHYRTWPWRVAVCTGESRGALGQVIAAALESSGEESARLEKTKTKFFRAPAVIIVGSVPGDDSLTQEENRDSVAAGIQNLLLLATAFGLASFWSTCPPVATQAVSQLAGFPANTHVTGLIYLGWPKKSVPAPDRPLLEPTFIEPTLSC